MDIHSITDQRKLIVFFMAPPCTTSVVVIAMTTTNFYSIFAMHFLLSIGSTLDFVLCQIEIVLKDSTAFVYVTKSV